MPRVPDFNGLMNDLNDAKRGYGLHLQTIQKLNSYKHLRTALRVRVTLVDLNSALAIRLALTSFIEDCDELTDEYKTVLDYVLNHKDTYNVKLGRREAMLQEDQALGRRLGSQQTQTALRMLAHQLLLARSASRA